MNEPRFGKIGNFQVTITVKSVCRSQTVKKAFSRSVSCITCIYANVVNVVTRICLQYMSVEIFSDTRELNQRRVELSSHNIF